jgi:hypothetical protein
MPVLLPWTNVEIGDLEVFVPSPPCLVVYTSYTDDGPESSVTYIWQDKKTGMLHHHLLYVEQAPFEAALAWAQEHAPTRKIERIHVKHATGNKTSGRKVSARRAVSRRPPRNTQKTRPSKKRSATKIQKSKRQRK